MLFVTAREIVANCDRSISVNETKAIETTADRVDLVPTVIGTREREGERRKARKHRFTSAICNQKEHTALIESVIRRPCRGRSGSIKPVAHCRWCVSRFLCATSTRLASGSDEIKSQTETRLICREDDICDAFRSCLKI